MAYTFFDSNWMIDNNDHTTNMFRNNNNNDRNYRYSDN
eukprot:UN04724